MRSLISLTILLIGFFPAISQDIHVTFTGTGESIFIDSIIATNLSTDKSITFPGAESLVLSRNTGIPTINELANTGKVFPNPFSGNTTLALNIQKSQMVSLKIQTLEGQVVAQFNAYVLRGENRFSLSVAKAGIYCVSVSSDKGTENYKVICSESTNSQTTLKLHSLDSIKRDYPSSLIPFGTKSLKTSNILGYIPGEIIHFECFSGTQTTIVADSPINSKTYEVEFVKCTDLGGQSYPVVKIGTQVWMARNLAYLPFVSSFYSNLTGSPAHYVYDYYGTNRISAKRSSIYETYGVLYNWEAAKTACPSRWHLPSKVEWELLFNFLNPKAGFKIRESGGKHWTSSNYTDEAGFAALPGGELYPYVAEDYTNMNISPDFINLGSVASFWTSSESEMYINGSSPWYIFLISTDNGYASDNDHSYIYTHYTYPFNNTKTSGYSVRCVKGTKPEIVTKEISQITINSAIGGGNIIDDGGTVVTSSGVCWSTQENPTIEDAKTDEGVASGSFTSTLTGIGGELVYYVRAYAINVAGISYGQEISFATGSGLASVETTIPSDIMDSTAISGGTIINDGGSEITERGVCWSTLENPSIADSKTNDGAGAGVFSSLMTNLNANTTYYVRAYASNINGTAYGDQIWFVTLEGTFIYFGKQYAYRKIGSQSWMTENLAYLPEVSPPDSGSNTSEHFYVYGYNGTDVNEAMLMDNYITYGVLYNLPAAINGESGSSLVPSGVQGICPPEWHLPSIAEYTILKDYLIDNGYGYEGSGRDIAKSMAFTSGWELYTRPGEIGNDQASNNTSGFSARPGGTRLNVSGFQNMGDIASFWTATPYYDQFSQLTLYSSADYVTLYSGYGREGLSVRCLKN